VTTKKRNNKRFIEGCFLPLVTIETTNKDRHLKPCGFLSEAMFFALHPKAVALLLIYAQESVKEYFSVKEK
jgi:hypothetical protein